MRRIAMLPFGSAVAASSFAVLCLAIMLRVGAAQPAPVTLLRYADVTAGSDSAALVRAASDALQGRSSVEVPMATTALDRTRRFVVVTLRPVATPGVELLGVAGTVRIYPDGRRVIVARE